MILHCYKCKRLRLCEPDTGYGGEHKARVSLSNLVEGKERGCNGCRLVCEVLPLLGGYYRSEADAHSIWFGRGTALLDGDGTGPWTLVAEDENKDWIGEFQLHCREGK
jgi:hypothetical protein